MQREVSFMANFQASHSLGEGNPMLLIRVTPTYEYGYSLLRTITGQHSVLELRSD